MNTQEFSQPLAQETQDRKDRILIPHPKFLSGESTQESRNRNLFIYQHTQYQLNTKKIENTGKSHAKLNVRTVLY